MAQLSDLRPLILKNSFLATKGASKVGETLKGTTHRELGDLLERSVNLLDFDKALDILDDLLTNVKIGAH